MLKLVLLISAGALSAVPMSALARVDYNRAASARAAHNWAFEARSMAPQVSEQAALDPQGPTLVASQPVPDTPANRARFGQPLSHAGRMTAPIGD